MKTKIGTHAGSYHADEVAAAVLLSILEGKDKVEIIRSKNPDPEADYLVDIGSRYCPEENLFDHHQGLQIQHPEGWPYASFGLVWEKYGTKVLRKIAETLMSREVPSLPADLAQSDVVDYAVGKLRDQQVLDLTAEEFRKKFVLPIDCWDNGVYPNTAVPMLSFSGIINSMSDSGTSFAKAVSLSREAIVATAKCILFEKTRAAVLQLDGMCSYPRPDIMVSNYVTVPTMHFAEKVSGLRLAGLVSPLDTNPQFFKLSCRKKIVSTIPPFVVTANGTKANFNNKQAAVAAALLTNDSH